ncbi:hypothetical protein D8O03_25030, partial [Burkholderia mallei]
ALRAHAAASGERFALQLRLPARGEPAILIPERQNPTLTKTWGSSAVWTRALRLAFSLDDRLIGNYFSTSGRSRAARNFTFR